MNDLAKKAKHLYHIIEERENRKMSQLQLPLNSNTIFKSQFFQSQREKSISELWKMTGIVFIIALCCNVFALAGENISVDYKFSDNLDYYVKIVNHNCNPYDNRKRDTNRNASVYLSNGTLLYKINTGSPKLIFLSNDGSKIITFREDSLVYYVNGIPTKMSSYCDFNTNNNLERCEEDDYGEFIYWNTDIRVFKDSTNLKRFPPNFFYFLGEKDGNSGFFKYKTEADSNLVFADKNPVFSIGDSIVIITKNLDIIKIDFSTFKYDIIDFQKNISYLKSALIKPLKSSEIIDIDIDFPNLESGLSVLEFLNSEFPNYQFEYYWKGQEKGIYVHTMYFKCYIYCDGKVDIIYDYEDLLSKQIVAVLNKQEFKTPVIPEIIEYHCLQEEFDFSCRDLEQAKAEYDSVLLVEKKIFERNAIADSIKGVYIPKNIDECMIHLDLLLDSASKKEIDGLQSENQMYNYHFSLGRQLRNYWGIWAGSRIYKYFEKYGYQEPDGISGIILRAYFKHRHKKKVDIEEVIDEDNNYFK